MKGRGSPSRGTSHTSDVPSNVPRNAAMVWPSGVHTPGDGNLPWVVRGSEGPLPSDSVQ